MPAPMGPKQAQLTCVIEAALDEIRDGLIDVYARLTGRSLPERPAPTEEQRAEWLEFRCFEQQTLGLR